VADRTTDIDDLEKFSIIVRYVDVEHFDVHDSFLGIYNPPSSRGDDLIRVIIDLRRLNIPISKLCGHSFDGASDMSVQAQLSQAQPQSVYMHCVNHSLDLTLQQVESSIPIVRESLSVVRDCAIIII
jgi:Domain of unknown function (DUF4371)